MEISEIQLVPTDELMEELFNRYDNALFIGTCNLTDKKDDRKDKMNWNRKGNIFSLLGMADFLKAMVNVLAREAHSE